MLGAVAEDVGGWQETRYMGYYGLSTRVPDNINNERRSLVLPATYRRFWSSSFQSRCRLPSLAGQTFHEASSPGADFLVWLARPSTKDGKDISIPALVTLPKSGKDQSDHSIGNRMYSKLHLCLRMDSGIDVYTCVQIDSSLLNIISGTTYIIG